LQAPRDEKTIITSIVQIVAENPVFDLLKAEPEYKRIVQKLNAFAKQPNN